MLICMACRSDLEKGLRACWAGSWVLLRKGDFNLSFPPFPQGLVYRPRVGRGQCLCILPRSVTSMSPEGFGTLGRGFCRPPSVSLPSPAQHLYPLFSGFAESLPAALIHGCLTGNSMHYSRPQRLPSSCTPGLIGYTLTFSVPNPDKTHHQGTTGGTNVYLSVVILLSV